MTRSRRRARLQAIRELVAREPIASQADLARRLAELGHGVTQATVSRDLAELRLVRVVRDGRHAYASPDTLAPGREVDDALLRRVIADLPIQVRRSGLILLVISTPGTASIIAEAIDRSSFEQVGTLAGDNTVLVLFGDEASLVRWRDRFARLQAEVAAD